ncbi:hypothetical protein Sjap_023169 [Stephania japonica]|uniref:Uncharacterized protein n=1 Tax=Stephania japonica TaxID=461633 RepID=A0AAP0EE75_9MAGN
MLMRRARGSRPVPSSQCIVVKKSHEVLLCRRYLRERFAKEAGICSDDLLNWSWTMWRKSRVILYRHASSGRRPRRRHHRSKIEKKILSSSISYIKKGLMYITG